MAHLIEYPPCLVCKKPSKVRVFNSRNGDLGAFCLTCGRRRLAAIEKSEKETPKPW